MSKTIWNKFQAIFVRDWKAKLICLLIAVALWTYVRISQYDTVHFEVPLSYKKISNQYVFLTEPPKSVSLAFQIRKGNVVLQNLTLRGEVDLSKVVLGWHEYPIKYNRLSLPLNIEVLSKPTVRLNMDQIKRKVIMLRVVPNKDLIPLYKISHPIISPDKVIIEGPESKLKLISKLEVPFVLDETKLEMDLTVPISYPDKSIKILNTNNVSIKIRIIDTTNLKDKQLESVPITIINQNRNANLVLPIKEVTVRVYGDAKALLNLRKSDIYSYVDFNGVDNIEDKQIELPVQAVFNKYNNDIVITSIEPSFVKVNIKALGTFKPKKIVTYNAPLSVDTAENGTDTIE